MFLHLCLLQIIFGAWVSNQKHEQELRPFAHQTDKKNKTGTFIHNYLTVPSPQFHHVAGTSHFCRYNL